ncbi:hypothetical protein GCM10007880_61150 [Mesorhizobium amorphae]|uniref:hypothetical protein n=1 Tax=Mesorhizobium amorphae TaxID=71433 RepID=UPI00235B811F|nr:hypothetical protein [Mesorhizobium amorphae]GLR45597.1 hypothetical protein GCM10007880_61150 [Mesorhizobium amorphae]
MGEAKSKRAVSFPTDEILKWESRDCVDFAVALARMTGWLLHVDWLADHAGGDGPDNISEAQMVPLRVYVGDDNDLIYDARGIKKIAEFNSSIVVRLARERCPPTFRNAGVATRTYDEERLRFLPIRQQADEAHVLRAAGVISKNEQFLHRIKVRPKPALPAKFAADYSFGLCAVFAQALEDLAGTQATAMVAHGKHQSWDTKVGTDGYFHSLVVHPDGTGEDSWGRQPAANICERFGIKEWSTDRSMHLRVVNNLRANSPDRFQKAYERAAEMISLHYGPERPQKIA